MATLESLMAELTRSFKPLATQIDNGQVDLVFGELGLTLPTTTLNIAGFKTSLLQLSAGVETLSSTISDLGKAIDVKDLPSILSKSISALSQIRTLFDAFTALATSLKNDVGSAALGISDAELTDFITRLPINLAEFLIITSLENNAGATADVLEFLHVIERTSVAPASGSTLPAYVKKEIHPAAFFSFISNPARHLETLYDWRTAAFDGKKLFAAASRILLNRGIPVIYDPVNAPSVLNAFFAKITIDTSGPVPGLLIEPSLDSYNATVDLEKDGWKFVADLGVNITDAFKLSLYPGGGIKVNAPGFTGGKLSASVTAGYPDKPMDIIGMAGSSGIQANSLTVDLENVIDSSGNGNISFSAALSKINVNMDLSSGDGFVKKVGGSGFQAGVDLKFGYAETSGFFIQGSGGFEIMVPTHVSIGPIDITAITISLTPGQGSLPLSVGGDIRASLGPLVVVINNIGLTLVLTETDDNSGNLGRVQLTPGFKPPNGVGLTVDTGMITGGGFLYLDPDKGQYYGSLELEFQNLFSLKAVGLINTKMPDGSPGFSLLIIITAEFTPIQLGFGFTLNGVGGLLGLNRTAKVDVLREGIKTNTLSSVLFPQDVVSNIGKIISDLTQIFPPYDGHFIVGPMGELGWSSIITIQMGILIEIPNPRLVILGVIKAIMPEEDDPLLKIQINFVGVIDFDNKTIAFDASLYDSSLLLYTLTGDMAFRLSWGDHKFFLLSVGGFNPAFKDAPADLQNMVRLSISLLASDDVKIGVTCYYAVTSNTVQYGAKVELYAKSGGFNVYGFLGYDELFQFNPFRFEADFYAGLSLRSGTTVLMSINLSGQFTGPTPFYVKGDASISILFFSISVSFHKTWGITDIPGLSELIDILSLLESAIADDRNWRSDTPSNNSQHVSIRQVSQTGAELVIHPFAVLTFSQLIVPLETDIKKFGNDAPKDVNHFTIVTADSTLHTVPAQEQFAPANFFVMSDEDKLSSPSFELMPSGFTATGSAQLQTPDMVSEDVIYRMSYLRKTKRKPVRAGNYNYAKANFASNLKAGAVSRSGISFANNRISVNAPDEVTVTGAEQFVIANLSDLSLYNSSAEAGSYAATLAQYRKLVSEQPGLKNKLQIVSSYELNPQSLS